MKYVNYYKNYITVKESLVSINNIDAMNILLDKMFSIFKSHLDIEKLFNDIDFNDIPYDIYDFFTDVKSLLQLDKDGIVEFANNMGLKINDNIISSILINIYQDKFKRNILSDLDICIKYLNNNKLSNNYKLYLDVLLEFKKLLE